MNDGGGGGVARNENPLSSSLTGCNGRGPMHGGSVQKIELKKVS